ncbi:MAG: nitrilase-related carbon-nitrogen hydrolase, partial [Frankia sp.]
MSDYTRKFVAATVQAEPVWLDLNGSVDKIIALCEEAAAEGAAIIAFPETWIPGYPWWIWLDSVAWQSQFVVRYAQNSLQVDSPEFEKISGTARRLGLAIVLGYSERVGGSLYMGQALIGSDGEVLKTRRKLKPTHVERSVFGEGDGSDIAVVDSEFGRLGALCCAEHNQPQNKYPKFGQQEQQPVAAGASFSV